MSMFALTNARGEAVDINNDKLLSYTPTGLGVQFSNTYSQYETYFKATKSTVTQGQFQIYILFGDVESQAYQTFSDFAQFLAYQPLTLTYTTDSGTWYRDGRLNSLTKTEIGGSTVFATDRINESFTLEFINNWYNNKSAEYKSYDPDPNLGTYGKIYGNQIADTSIKPSQVNSKGQTNKLANTEFSPDFSGWYDRGLYGKGIKAALGNPFNGSSVFMKVDGGPTRLQSAPIAVVPGTKISYSVQKLASSSVWSYINNVDVNGNMINVPGTSSPEFGAIQSLGYTKVENILIPSGVVYISFGIYLGGISNGNVFSQPMLVFDTTVGDYVQGLEYNHVATPAYTYAYAPYYVYQESNRPSNEKVMSLNNKSQYFGLQSGSPSVITVNGPCSVNPTWTVVQNGNVVATDGFVLTLTDNQKLVVSSYPEDQYARIYNPDGSYVDVSQLQDYTKTNFVQIPEGESTVLFYLDANSDVNITFKEERLLV